jgi:hypothetical protein
MSETRTERVSSVRGAGCDRDNLRAVVPDFQAMGNNLTDSPGFSMDLAMISALARTPSMAIAHGKAGL